MVKETIEVDFCGKCEASGFLCMHPERVMYSDDCPEGFNFDCLDCNFIKECPDCKGVGTVEK